MELSFFKRFKLDDKLFSTAIFAHQLQQPSKNRKRTMFETING